MTTLQECIDRWHAAHPNAVLTFECVAPMELVRVEAINLPEPPHGARIAAGRIGITTEEYVRRTEAGERWCSYCESWCEDWRKALATQSYCPLCWPRYQRSAKRRRQERRAS